MTRSVLPFERYPGAPPLFLDFVKGGSPFYPDPPTIEAAEARAREILGRKARIPAAAFRTRAPAGRSLAEDLAAGRAVAVIAGHQVGLFTGPLFTLVKAFDAIRVARQLRERGLPAVAVFWALTDDHDLEEVAQTARPGPDGPEVYLLEGADRANRCPVGTLPIPAKIREVLEKFSQDAREAESRAILEEFAARYAPGVSYGTAFIETLLDLVEPDTLLVLDPLSDELGKPAADFFLLAFERQSRIHQALQEGEARVARQKGEAPVAYRPEVFPFFAIRNGERRRIEDLAAFAREVEAGEVRVSADVLTRPVLKSFLLPIAASVLGPAEIAYHAQALPLFSILDVPPPVLLPRSHVILRGPAERRAAESLGLSEEELFSPAEKRETEIIPAVSELDRIARAVSEDLQRLARGIEQLDPTLVGALETARRKVAYQFEQLSERMRKAAQRKDETAFQRRRRLETMLLPQGKPAERLYPPLVPLLSYGKDALLSIREAATGSREGAVLMDLPREGDEAERKSHAG